MRSAKIQLPIASEGKRFTLIELLVVISIISALAAMLLPALTEVKNSARTAVCLNNLKQTILAVHMYRHQYKAICPPTVGYGDQWGGQYEGQELLYEANLLDRNHVISCASWGNMTEREVAPVRRRSVLLCPSGERFNHLDGFWKFTALANNPGFDKQEGWCRWSYGVAAPGDPPWFNGPANTATIFWSYGINSSLATNSDPLGTHLWKPLRHLDAPAKKVYMMECYFGDANGCGAGKMKYEVDRGDVLGYGNREFRFAHGRASNYICYDGHTGSLSRGDFLAFDIDPGAAEDQLPFEF